MRGSSAVKNWARVHLFRTGTAVLTLVLLGLCFFYSPALLTWWLRATMRIIETVAGLLPYPWGDRVEIAMRALGGSLLVSHHLRNRRGSGGVLAGCGRLAPPTIQAKPEGRRR
jgi:hypothetical protein